MPALASEPPAHTLLQTSQCTAVVLISWQLKLLASVAQWQARHPDSLRRDPSPSSLLLFFKNLRQAAWLGQSTVECLCLCQRRTGGENVTQQTVNKHNPLPQHRPASQAASQCVQGKQHPLQQQLAPPVEPCQEAVTANCCTLPHPGPWTQHGAHCMHGLGATLPPVPRTHLYGHGMQCPLQCPCLNDDRHAHSHPCQTAAYAREPVGAASMQETDTPALHTWQGLEHR